MSYTVVKLNENNGYKEEFFKLPKRIYSSKELMQNEKEERNLLNGTHLLSHYFKIYGLVVVDENGKAVSRCAVTIYPGDTIAYLGFFESENNPEAVRLLFAEAEKLALEKGAKELVGPVDASFWIKYRMKINRFGSPYTGEPYNPSYYLKLWQQCGYEEYEHYFSNQYVRVENDEGCEKYAGRLEDKLKAGYSIESVDPKEFNQKLKEVYEMMIELYSGFLTYKRITEEEFAQLFGYYKSIMKFNMVKMAYYHNKPVGFFISIPNYGNTVYGKLSLLDYGKILLTRSRPKSYVMLYMGVDFSHKGLGKALAETIRNELKEEGVPSVGALIRRGNCNKDYFAELIEYEYEYILLKKEILGNS